MTTFEQISIEETVPTFIDHGALARWAEANRIPLETVALVLAKVVDQNSNIGMDTIRHLLDALGQRVPWPQDLSHIANEEDRYNESLFLMIRSGKISDEGLREIVELAGVDNRYDCEPFTFDVELGYAAECSGCGIYWIGTECGCE